MMIGMSNMSTTGGELTFAQRNLNKIIEYFNISEINKNLSCGIYGRVHFIFQNIFPNINFIFYRNILNQEFSIQFIVFIF